MENRLSSLISSYNSRLKTLFTAMLCSLFAVYRRNVKENAVRNSRQLDHFRHLKSKDIFRNFYQLFEMFLVDVVFD